MSRSRLHATAQSFALCALVGLPAACAVEDDPSFDPLLEEELAGDVARRPKLDPVIFVHGCPPPPFTNEEEITSWFPMVEFLQERGYPASHLTLFLSPTPVCDSNLTQARQLEDLVAEVRRATHARKVDIVAHSMGNLVTRTFLLEHHPIVDDFVSLGAPNHGSAVAAAGVEWQAIFGAPAYEGAKEMFPPYACAGQTVMAADVQAALNGCLTPLGRLVAKDETPGDVSYLVIRNTLDEMVQPGQSACLNQRFMNDCSSPINVAVTVPAGLCGPDPASGPCPGHVRMQFDPDVMQMTYEALTDD